MKLSVAKIEGLSLVDGPGARTVVWLAGCDVHCPGCQNKELWDVNAGQPMEAHQLAATLVKVNHSHGHSHLYTITGGEPLLQREGLAAMLRHLRHYEPGAHIVLYTGHRWQDVAWWRDEAAMATILGAIDVLVEGPYIAEEDDDYIQYRGSQNQKVVDVNATLASEVWPATVQTLDWDTPQITIQAGRLVLTGGLAQDLRLTEVGQVSDAPLCGQYTEGDHGQD